MAQYGVITLQSLKTTTNIMLRTIVCGNFLRGATFGSQLTQSTFYAQNSSLEINGSTSPGNSINIDRGSVILGPYPTNRIVKLNTNQYTVDNQLKFNLNQGSSGAIVHADATLPSKCAKITSSIQYLSKTFSQLPPNNNVTIPASQPGPAYLYVYNVDSNGVAVFNLSGAAIFNTARVQTISLISYNTNLQLVILNVYGTSATFSSISLTGNWFGSTTTGQSHTIWNFYQATSLTFQSNMKGAVLAPYASLTITTQLNGAVAVNSLDATGAIIPPLPIFPNCTSTPPQSTTITTSKFSKQ